MQSGKLKGFKLTAGASRPGRVVLQLSGTVALPDMFGNDLGRTGISSDLNVFGRSFSRNVPKGYSYIVVDHVFNFRACAG